MARKRETWDKPIRKVKITKRDGEYIVKAYDENGKHMPNSDYFTDDKDDAKATAKAMVLLMERDYVVKMSED